MDYINHVVQDCGLYSQGGSGLEAILTRWFRTGGYIHKVVQDWRLYSQGGSGLEAKLTRCFGTVDYNNQMARAYGL